jgi:glycosyltransferase involved in cell wall biosynthesis
MRVLVVSHTCLIDIYQATYRALERLGHSITIVTPSNWREVDQPQPVRVKRLEGFTGNIIPLPVAMAGSYPLHGYLASLGRTMAAARPDVVYIDQEPYSVSAFQSAMAASRHRFPAVFYSNQNILKVYPPPFRWSERMVWDRCRSAVVVSQEVEQVLRGRGYAGPVHRIPYSVDTAMFEESPVDHRLRAELGLRGQVIAYLGRLVPQKGIEVLLDAYSRLPSRSATSLLIVGSGPLEARCRTVEGAVVVTDVAHAEVPRYLKLADVVVLPSLTTPTWKEQFGRVIIEALAAGVPVVGSDSGEIPHLLDDTGGGLVVPEGKPDELAKTITTLLESPELRMRIAASGRDRVRSRYTTEARALALEAVLSEAAGEESTRTRTHAQLRAAGARSDAAR